MNFRSKSPLSFDLFRIDRLPRQASLKISPQIHMETQEAQRKTIAITVAVDASSPDRGLAGHRLVPFTRWGWAGWGHSNSQMR
jgi:hypothetical protein